MPSIGQTWVLASIGAVVEMGVLISTIETTDTRRVLRARETTARGVYNSHA
jgi:hypothetical protein